MMTAAPRNPLISIIGTTGTGKSKLAVALARRFGGEIINGDALQLYEGLPIVTNKIRASEMCGVRHHLLGRLRLDEEPWNVSQFTPEALRIIESIKSRGKLPILVGGTHYYTQSLLFREQTIGSHIETDARSHLSFAELEERWPILKGSEEEILKKLQEVDPETAAKWHPKDARRIRRGLEIWLQTGKRASEHYANQKKNSSTNSPLESVDTSMGKDREALRFDSLTFCTYTETEVLDQRLADRVDEMVEEGLLTEIKLMRRQYQELMEGSVQPNPTRGIWVAIGYKEFSDYLSAIELGTATDDHLIHLRKEAIERTKIATRQYARKQIRWIRNKLLPALIRAAGEEATILLDYTSLSEWKEKVEDAAIALTGDFLHSRPLKTTIEMKGKLAQLLVDSKPDGSSRLPQPVTCDVCGVIVLNKDELEKHPRTTKHKRALRQRRRDRGSFGPEHSGQL